MEGNPKLQQIRFVDKSNVQVLFNTASRLPNLRDASFMLTRRDPALTSALGFPSLLKCEVTLLARSIPALFDSFTNPNLQDLTLYAHDRAVMLPVALEGVGRFGTSFSVS